MDHTLKIPKDLRPPPLPRYASWSNRRSEKWFKTHTSKESAMQSMGTHTSGMPHGGVLYELDGNEWREIWRWQPPSICAICNKNLNKTEYVSVIPHPAEHKWWMRSYVHYDCRLAKFGDI